MDFCRIFGMALIVFCSISCFGDFKTINVLYENNFTDKEVDQKMISDGIVFIPNGGKDFDGALWIEDPNFKRISRYLIKVDSTFFEKGGWFALEVIYRGDNLAKGTMHFHGHGFGLHFNSTIKGGKEFWNGASAQHGTTAWTKSFCVFFFQPNEVSNPEIYISSHLSKGDLFVDRVRLLQVEQVADSEVIVPDNPEAKKIRRGRDIKVLSPQDYHSVALTRYRGVMVSPLKISPEDIDELGRWGANLVRFALSSSSEAQNDEEYLTFIQKRMEHLDGLLPHFARNGIKVVVHPPAIPKGKKTVFASLNLEGVTDFTVLEKAWRMIAEHYNGNPNIYGYDILNEPENISAETWHNVVAAVVKSIRSVDRTTLIINPKLTHFYTDENMAYTPHFYTPHSLTHQGLGFLFTKIAWKYPGYVDGIYMNKEQLRLELKSVIDFQEKYNAKIYIGEFSCIAWAEGRDQYIRDCIELFEEYGWDWTYHAFREWDGWSVEYERAGDFSCRKAEGDTPAKKTLLKYFQLNKSSSPDN